MLSPAAPMMTAAVFALSSDFSRDVRLADGLAGGLLVDDGASMRLANAATSDWRARLLTARGRPRADWWMWASASSVESLVSINLRAFEPAETKEAARATFLSGSSGRTLILPAQRTGTRDRPLLVEEAPEAQQRAE
jgi:hypothetical protein